MKLKLISNEGESNTFDVYLEPTRELIGNYVFNIGDEITFEVGESEGLSTQCGDNYDYQFISGSI